MNNRIIVLCRCNLISMSEIRCWVNWSPLKRKKWCWLWLRDGWSQALCLIGNAIHYCNPTKMKSQNLREVKGNSSLRSVNAEVTRLQTFSETFSNQMSVIHLRNLTQEPKRLMKHKKDIRSPLDYKLHSTFVGDYTRTGRLLLLHIVLGFYSSKLSRTKMRQ